MKRIILSVISLSFIFFSACSVQETMSPQIFINRLSKINQELDFESAEHFMDGNKFCFFIKNKNSTNFLIEITVNENGHSEKISVACSNADKIGDFINCVESVIKTYAPDDDISEIISKLNINRNKLVYQESQWHSYSALINENGIYFSISNKKLIPSSKAELSLKPNDRVDF